MNHYHFPTQSNPLNRPHSCPYRQQKWGKGIELDTNVHINNLSFRCVTLDYSNVMNVTYRIDNSYQAMSRYLVTSRHFILHSKIVKFPNFVGFYLQLQLTRSDVTMDLENKIDVKTGMHGIKFLQNCSAESLSQRSECLKNDVTFLRDHIKALRAMSIVSLSTFLWNLNNNDTTCMFLIAKIGIKIHNNVLSSFFSRVLQFAKLTCLIIFNSLMLQNF